MRFWRRSVTQKKQIYRSHHNLNKKGMDLTDLIKTFASSSNIKAMSQQAGTDQAQTAAIITQALPMLMKGMQQNASSEQGAQSLAKALDDHGGADIGDANSFLKGLDMQDSSKILKHVLGGNSSTVQSGLAKQTGVSSAQVGSIMTMLAPMLLSFLGSQKKQNNVSASGLGGLLSSMTGGQNDGFGLDDVIGMVLGGNGGGNSNSGGLGGVLSGLGKMFGK